MSATLGKIAQAVTKFVHTKEVQHDVALFVGTLAATGVIGDLAGHGVPLTWDALAALIVTAARRAAVLRLSGK